MSSHLAPLKTPLWVKLNTSEHPAPYVWRHAGQIGEIIAISEGLPELGFHCDVRLPNGETVWLSYNMWLELIDCPLALVSTVLVDAAREAWKDNFYSKYY